jgi:hypothetical protein
MSTPDLVASTAWALLNKPICLKTGCSRLDDMLGGGLSLGVTEFVGEAGVGKTQWLLQLCLSVQRAPVDGGLGGYVFLMPILMIIYTIHFIYPI